MKTLLIINPYSRGGDIDSAEIVAALEDAGPVEVTELGPDVSVARRIAELRPQLDRIVVAGGDGTLNGVLAEVLDAELPLGIIPLGTANDFARSLDLPDDPVDAAKCVAAGCVRRVDVGEVNGRLFLNAVGVGLGPELTRELDREKKKRFGVLAYFDSLMHVLGKRRRRRARLTVDGKPIRTRFVQVTIANGRHYGGGMTICNDAQVHDGLLHVLCVRPLTAWQLFLRGVRFKFGDVTGDEKLTYETGREVWLETAKQCDATADGEMLTKTPLKCTVHPQALQVYVPDESAAIGNHDESMLSGAIEGLRSTAAA